MAPPTPALLLASFNPGNQNFQRLLGVVLVVLVWLFFFRVIRAVWAEMRPPKARRTGRGTGAAADLGAGAWSGPDAYAPAPPVPAAGAVPGIPGAPTAAAAAAAAAGGAPAGNGAGPAAAGGRRGRAGRSQHAQLHFKVVEPENERGRFFDLGDEATVGRAPGCAVRVDDAYTSSIHARVFRRDGTLYVEDLGSTNGTWVNGRRVAAATKVGRGDLVQVGGTVFEVSR